MVGVMRLMLKLTRSEETFRVLNVPREEGYFHRSYHLPKQIRIIELRSYRIDQRFIFLQYRSSAAAITPVVRIVFAGILYECPSNDIADSP